MADRSLDADVQSDYLSLSDGNFEAFTSSGTAIVIGPLVFGESVSLRFHVDPAGTTDDIEISVGTGHLITSGNGLDAGTSTTVVELNTTSDSFSTDDDMNGLYFVMTSGGEVGDFRLITDSAATNDQVTLDHALSGTPSISETYSIYALDEYKFQIDCSAALSETNPLTAGITVDWRQGQYVVVRARAVPGGTNTQRIRMSYQTDSGPA